MPHLRDVRSFGGTDADADDLLSRCFQTHRSYLDARDCRCFLIVGRKGSGKTAIFKKLISRRHLDVFSRGYDFEDYPWSHDAFQAVAGAPGERRYIAAWRYLMLMGLSQLRLNADQSPPHNQEAADSIRALEAFIVDSYGDRDPDPSTLFSSEARLNVKATLNLPFFSATGEKIEGRKLPAHIAEVNRAIQHHLLSALNPVNKYYLCFDRLDRGYAASTDDEGKLKGLILAAWDLFDAAKSRGLCVNPVIFLRDDIYDSLHFEDKNKITESRLAHVRWSESGALTLKQLMESRFREVLGRPGVAWEEVFEESADGAPSLYSRICERTFMRPRDIIKYCNEVLNQFHQRGGHDVDVFREADVDAAFPQYSEFLASELDDEIRKHVPLYEEYFNILRIIDKVEFELSEFVLQFNRMERRSTFVVHSTAQQALEEMFSFSVLGYVKVRGRDAGNGVVWRHLDPRAQYDQDASRFRVHAGLWDRLDLRYTT